MFGLLTILLGAPFFASPATAEAEIDVGKTTESPAVDSAPAAKLELSVVDAVIIGLVEGVTEYLPVSSTGHILVTNELLGLNDTEESENLLEAYAICVQAGAILAVLVVYQERIRQLIDGLIGRSAEGRQILLAVIAAFIPTAIIAQFIFEPVRRLLFGVGPIAIAWIGGGMMILYLSRANFFDRPGKELHNLTLQNAAVIGLMQAIAVWPGVSRSLITIIAGVLVGMTLRAAVEFSFLLGLLTLTAATAYAGLQDGSAMVEAFGWFTPAVGLVVAFVSAVAAVRWMVSFLNTKGFEVFGWYRLAVGVAALVLIGVGTLPFGS